MKTVQVIFALKDSNGATCAPQFFKDRETAEKNLESLGAYKNEDERYERKVWNPQKTAQKTVVYYISDVPFDYPY